MTRRAITRLEYERRRRGLSQTALAGPLGVHQSDISDAERCKATRPGVLDKLSAFFGLPAAVLAATVDLDPDESTTEGTAAQPAEKEQSR